MYFKKVLTLLTENGLAMYVMDHNNTVGKTEQKEIQKFNAGHFFGSEN
jgi:hypothetical protein